MVSVPTSRGFRWFSVFCGRGRGEIGLPVSFLSLPLGVFAGFQCFCGIGREINGLPEWFLSLPVGVFAGFQCFRE